MPDETMQEEAAIAHCEHDLPSTDVFKRAACDLDHGRPAREWATCSPHKLAAERADPSRRDAKTPPPEPSVPRSNSSAPQP